MRILGITGGIASGKSTITRMLGALGAETRSADEDARAVLADGSPVLAAVLSAFPQARDPDTGALNRARLAATVFSDANARARLEEIMHPAIIARMRAAVTQARRSGPGILVYETPLLYEAGLEDLFDEIIAVLASPGLQRERLQAREQAAGRPPLTEDDLTGRLAAQLSPEEKARRADHILRTDGSLTDTESQVRRLWQRLAG